MRAKIAQPTAKTLVTQLELVGLRGKLVGITDVGYATAQQHSVMLKSHAYVTNPPQSPLYTHIHCFNRYYPDIMFR